ncbi:unnamed protein product [Sympodiomycopsis kandeliae]
MDTAQIAIPDLDDDDALFASLPQPSFAAHHNATSSLGGGGGGSGSEAGGAFEDLPGPSRPWLRHGRSGSGTSGESSNNSAFVDSGGSGGESSSLKTANGNSNWAFPRKGSFASLKAAIKGQSSQQHQHHNQGNEADQTIPSSSTTRTFSRSQSSNNAIKPTANSTSGHGRTDSGVSIQSRNYPHHNNHYHGHHPQQSSSYFSEASMATSSNHSHSQTHMAMPPIPPLPDHYANTPAANDFHHAPPQTGTSSAFSDHFHGHGPPPSVEVYPSSTAYYPQSATQAAYYPYSTPDDDRMPASAPLQSAAMVPPPPSSAPSSRMRTEAPLGLSQQNPHTLPNGIGSADPRTPLEYAHNVLMSRFLSRTRIKIQVVLDHGMEAEPHLDHAFGPRADQDFEVLLSSLAHVSRANPKLVIESLFNWQAMHIDTPVDADTVRRAMDEAAHINNMPATPGGSNSSSSINTTANGITGVKDVAAVLKRRKFLVCTYLLARALIQVARQIQPGSIPESSLGSFLSNLFDLLQSSSRNRVPRSTMQSNTFDQVSTLLGELSKKFFTLIGDRFISMLEHCAKVPPSKNVELAQETAVEGMRHLEITVFPMEVFEEGAEFTETVARFFASAHGQRVKSAYAETLTHLILPVAKSASAEINHPTWTKAMETIAPRAHSMAAKPRYWAVAFPLYVACLCGSPDEQFIQGIGGGLPGWVACLESAMPRTKDRSLRPIIMNTAVRLIWVYMFRCRESSNATTKRLETFYRQWFPASRSSINPAEGSLVPHIHMVHLVLYRHFDYGRDLVLDFLRHKALGGSTLSLQPEILAHNRMIIAIQAILLTLDAYVKSESPPFPSNADFMRLELPEADNMGDELPEDFTFAKPEIGEAQAKFNDLIGKIALICDHQVSHNSVFDESTVVIRGAQAPAHTVIDHEKYLTRSFPRNKITLAYPREQQPFMDLLRSCFQSWPRCLSSSIPFASVLSVLFKAHFNADPHLGEAASQALRRIAKQRKNGAAAVVSSFGRSIFRTETIFWETHPHQLALLFKVEAAVKVWIEFLNIRLKQLRSSQAAAQGVDAKMERTSAWAINDEVEAYGLLLLCSGHKPLRRQALSILRLVSVLDDAFLDPSTSNANAGGGNNAINEPTRIIHLLDLPCREFCNVEDSQLTAEQRQKVQEWTRNNSMHPLGDLAESDSLTEHTLWQHVLPRFLRMCLEHFPTTVAVFRSHVTNRVLSMDAAVAISAGLVPRTNTTHGTTKSIPTSSSMGGLAAMPQGMGSEADQALMTEHWKMYILALCTTTTSTEGSRGALNAGGHRRQNSDSGSSERVIAARDLFQKLVPFLASDQAKYRQAVVTALGNINVNLYRTLLETLQAVSSQLTEGTRSKTMGGINKLSAPARRHSRLRTALAHVVQLTSSHMSGDATLSDNSIMTLILNWVKDTFNFLVDREVKSDWEFQKLRRFFSGVVEDLFNGLIKRGESEKYFPFDTRLRMMKLFSEWYSFSQSAKDGPAKLTHLLSTVAEENREDKQREVIIANLRIDTQALAFHASDAMATLCQGSITSIDVSTSTTTTMMDSPFRPEYLVNWLEGLFKSSAPINHAVARRALRSLLMYNGNNEELIAAIINTSFREADPDVSTRSLFACFSEAVVTCEASIRIPVHHIFCLSLTKLGHPDAELRRKAFALIDWAARREDASISLHDVEVGVSSPLPATYLRSQRDISAHLAHHFGSQRVAMICEYTLRLEYIEASRRSTTLGLLPDWLRDVDLFQGAESAGGGSELTYCSLLILTNLLFLTIRYGDEHNFELQDAWASLAEGNQVILNANAIIKFLIEQGLCFRSPEFIIHAKRVVSCLSHTVLSPHMFDELCAFIEPNSMIPVPREEVGLQKNSIHAYGQLFLASLPAVVPTPSTRHIYSPGQLALLLIGELTYERSERLLTNLPLLLHAIFVQVDSYIPFIQEQNNATFEQLLRTLASMSASVSGNQGANLAKNRVEALFGGSSTSNIFWSQNDLEVTLDEVKSPKTMRNLLYETVSILSPLSTTTSDWLESWSKIALFWATSGSVRHIACRSFQIFRIILPVPTPTMLADMLGRLSNTISDPSLDIQSFALEIMYTLTALVKSSNIFSDTGAMDHLFGPTFWATLACLNTINEREYAVAIEMLDALLDRLDIGDAQVIAMLRAECPEGWEGEVGGIQPLVLRGLRSSVTSAASFKILCRLAKVQDSTLIDVSQDDRLAFLFVNALPCFLQATDTTGPARDENALELASDISILSEAAGKADLSRVSTSIAKSRFRTKDDLIRQAVHCIRSNFLPRFGPQLAVSLLGLTLNQHEWLRNQSMQVLKFFFQVVDTQSAEFSSLGSELLMPLLRLLSTPLATQALEVLDEPIAISGGPSANAILRMSLQWGKPLRRREMQGNDTSIFGTPDDSGWAVANLQEFTSKSRINIQAVFKACELTLDVAPVSSMVDFVNEDYYEGNPQAHNGITTNTKQQPQRSEEHSTTTTTTTTTNQLTEIVNQLQDLSSFFSADDTDSTFSHSHHHHHHHHRHDHSSTSNSGIHTYHNDQVIHDPSQQTTRILRSE